MITLKLPYKNDEMQNFLKKIRIQYSSLVRYSYNRFREGLSLKDIEHSLKINNIDLLDSWFRRCAILEGKYVFEKNNKKIIFGGKNNFKDLIKNKITKEQYKEKRLLAITIQGEKNYYGNRKFKLDIINNKIIFKYNRLKYFYLQLPKVTKNYFKHLINLQELCDEKKYKYSIKLNDKYIFISFDEIKENEIDLKFNRFIGIDLNPSNIGISVCEFENELKIINTYCFDFKKIINIILKLKVSSNDKKLYHWNSKLNYEILQISKEINKISKYYECKYIFIEDLNFKKDLNINSLFNRLTKNLWKKIIFINNLEKRCNINNQKLFKINPAYSSIIGNLMYDCLDSVNASIEIARRGYEIVIKRNKRFYPTFIIKNSIQHQWKEMGIVMNNNWIEVFKYIKNTKFKYRVTLQKKCCSVFQFKSLKSYVTIYNQKIILNT